MLVVYLQSIHGLAIAESAKLNNLLAGKIAAIKKFLQTQRNKKLFKKYAGSSPVIQTFQNAITTLLLTISEMHKLEEKNRAFTIKKFISLSLSV